MSLQQVPASHAYRRLVAAAAANGTVISPLATMVFSDRDTPYQPETDTTATATAGEIARVAITRTVNGAAVLAVGVLQGAVTAGRTVRSVAVLTGNGVLVGRRVIAPKELEPEAQIEVEIAFEY